MKAPTELISAVGRGVARALGASVPWRGRLDIGGWAGEQERGGGPGGPGRGDKGHGEVTGKGGHLETSLTAGSQPLEHGCQIQRLIHIICYQHPRAFDLPRPKRASVFIFTVQELCFCEFALKALSRRKSLSFWNRW